MSPDNWLKSFNKLNDSFSKKMIFRLGADAGYFSEFNNMVLAIAYCLSRKIKFVLYSECDLYSPENAWNDFFKPFCKQNTFEFGSSINLRPYQINNNFKFSVLKNTYKRINNADYLTQDLWPEFHDDINNFSKELFTIPELEIFNVNLLQVTQVIIKNIWQYNSKTLEIIQQLKNSLELPDYFVSVHIRSGDKFLEKELFSLSAYMNVVGNLKCNNIFVLTDDYSIIEKLKNNYANYSFFTLCDSSENGYFHKDFIKLNSYEKYLRHLNLFASIDICAESLKFVGTYSSNPGMYMGLRIGENNCIGIDYKNWLIW